MPQRLTPTQAVTVRSAERRLSAAVAHLRGVRESGVVYQRTIRAIVEDCGDIAERLDALLAELEAAE